MRVHGFRGPVPPGKVGSGLVLRSVYPQQVAVTSWEGWLVLAAGVVFVAAWAAGLVLSAPAPGVNDSVGTIAAYYRAHGSTVLLATYLVDGVAAIALMVFAATLRSLFQRAESWGTPLSAVLFAGGVAAATLSLVQGTCDQVLVHTVALGDTGLIRALAQLNAEADTFKLLPLAVLAGATSALVLRSHGRPRWLGWFGLALAPGLVAGGWSFTLSSAPLTVVLDVALLALVCWVASVSVVMFRHAATGSVLLAAEPEPRRRRPR
jgi:hypothetical protein